MLFKKVFGSMVAEKTKQLALFLTIILLLSCIATFFVVSAENMMRPIRVACVGDSITEGSGYPFKLQTMLGSSYIVGNFGVRGSTVSQSSIKPYMNQTSFRQAKDFIPDIVVIMLGTNDANPEITQNTDEFESDYSQLINSFQQLDGEQSIWVAISPPIFRTTSSWNSTCLTNDIIPQIDSVAKQMDLPTINIYDAFGDRAGYFADGIHPNSDGATLIASTIFDNLTMQDNSQETTSLPVD